MLNSKGLLDQIMGGLNGMQQGGLPTGMSQGQPPAQAGQHQTPQQPSAIDSVMGGLGGLSGQAGGGGVGSSVPGGVAGLAGAAGAGGLAGLLLGSKKGRKFAGKAAKYGGMAVLGALAYGAWQRHQSNQMPGQGGAAQPMPQPAHAPAATYGAQPSPATSVPPVAPAPVATGTDLIVPQNEQFIPLPETAAADSLAKILLQTMIAAAKADGHIDDVERTRIYDAISQSDLDPEEKVFIFEELKKPLDVDAVAALAQSPEMASEMYAASVVMVAEIDREERRYLDRLAARLNLPASLQDEIEAEIAALEDV